MRRQIRAREDRRQATDFKEAVCCPCAVVQGAAQQKMNGSARGNWEPQEDQQPFRPNPNGVRDCTTTLRWLLIGVALNFREASLAIQSAWREKPCYEACREAEMEA